MAVPCWTVRKAVSCSGKPHRFQRKPCALRAGRSSAAKVRQNTQVFLCRRSSRVLGVACLGVVASANGKQSGETVCACPASAGLMSEALARVQSASMFFLEGRWASRVVHNAPRLTKGGVWSVGCVPVPRRVGVVCWGYIACAFKNSPPKEAPAEIGDPAHQHW